ncbi:DUF1573 domain-containing protein, partial [bacterium]
MALLLQQAGERSHSRPADRQAVDVELWRFHSRAFSFKARECNIPGFGSTPSPVEVEEHPVMKHGFKTAILALSAVLLVAATLLAAGKPKAVAVEPIKDAGNVPKGDKIIHDFVIRNDGDAPLEITQVHPACGCTVVEFDKTIAPGQTGKIHAVLDTSTFNGAISKGVSVFTNDTDTPQIELTVRAKVEPFIAVKPGYARYITVQGEQKEGTITQTLWATDGAPLDVVKVESPYPFLKTSFREAKPEERLADGGQGKQWKV